MKFDVSGTFSQLKACNANVAAPGVFFTATAEKSVGGLKRDPERPGEVKIPVQNYLFDLLVVTWK